MFDDIFQTFVFIVVVFQLYMLPLGLLVLFLRNYVIMKIKAKYGHESDEVDTLYDYFQSNMFNVLIDEIKDKTFDSLISEDDDSIGDLESKEIKKSFREKLAEIQEICLRVQEALDNIASLGERVVK